MNVYSISLRPVDKATKWPDNIHIIAESIDDALKQANANCKNTDNEPYGIRTIATDVRGTVLDLVSILEVENKRLREARYE